MINIQAHIDDLNERLDSAVRIIDATHAGQTATTPVAAGAITREARGMAVVLVFAAYENLMRTLTRSLLEAAIKLRVGNRRLQPGFRAIALAKSAQSIKDLSDKKLFSHGLPRLVDAANRGGRTCTIDPNTFPDDGSFMKTTQIQVWCDVFDIKHPQALLQHIWLSIDTVVSDRNGVAHGRLTADAVGRNYTEAEIRHLIESWRLAWTGFLLHVGSRASTRDFFRLNR